MSEAANGYSSRSRGGPATWRVTAIGGGQRTRIAASGLCIGLAGWAYGALVMWAFIALLRGLLGRSGMVAGTLVAHVIGSGPRGAVTGFAGTMGVPVHWQVPLLHLGGWVWPATLVAFRPWLAVVALVPLLAALVMGWLVSKAAAKYSMNARYLLAASAVGFALTGSGVVFLSGLGSSSPLLTLAASPAWTLPLGAAWAMLGGSIGVAARESLARHRRLPEITVTRRVARKAGAAAATLLVLGSPVIAAGAAEAAACTGTPGACNAGNDGFITAIAYGSSGLNPSGPSASQILNSGYHFQNFLNYVQEFWMTHETNTYWNDNQRMIQLIQASPALAKQAAATLQTWEPALAAVQTPAANWTVITQTMVNQASSLANAFINADLASPTGGVMAQSFQTEQSKINWSELVGLTVNQAVNYLNQHVTS
jgi:hypothetical protein